MVAQKDEFPRLLGCRNRRIIGKRVARFPPSSRANKSLGTPRLRRGLKVCCEISSGSSSVLSSAVALAPSSDQLSRNVSPAASSRRPPALGRRGRFLLEARRSIRGALRPRSEKINEAWGRSFAQIVFDDRRLFPKRGRIIIRIKDYRLVTRRDLKALHSNRSTNRYA